jgi:multiple sugar transport system substrate-binding protein
MFRKLSALLLVVVMVLAMGACGTTAGKPAAAPATEAATAVESTPAAAPEETAAEVPAATKPEDIKGNVVMWNWENQDQLKTLIAEFNTRYPNVSVESVVVASADYVKKVQTAVASNGQLPDVIRGELNFRGTLFSMNILEDLSGAPYNFDKSKIPEQAWPLVMDDSGKVLGALTQFNPSGIAYRRSTVKTFLGTDNPSDVQSMFTSWDDVINKFKDAQIDGKKLFAFRSVRDIFTIVDGYNPTNPIEGDVIKFKEVYLPTFQIIEKMYKAGVVDKLDFWTPAWNASFPAKNYAFSAAAPWFLKYVVEPNDPDGKGDWGITVPPGGMFNWGGTCLSVWKDSKVKDASWAYISDQILNEKGVKNSFVVGMNITPVKEFMDKPGFYSQAEPYWGNQDIGKFFMDNMHAVKVKKLGKYDSYLEANFVLGLQEIKAGKTADEAVNAMIADIKKNVPELKE